MTAFHPAGAPQLFPSMMAKSYAPHRVWKGGTSGPKRFKPLAKRDAVKYWHELRRYERSKRRGAEEWRKVRATGKRPQWECRSPFGVIGLKIMQVLIFDFLNFKSGRLDPSYEAIAAKAGCSPSSVYRSLQRFKAAGVLNWVQHLAGQTIDGRFTLEQETNAYGIAPPSCWRGWYVAPPAPAPDRGTTGAPDPVGAAGYMPGASDRVQSAANAMPEGASMAIARLDRMRRR